MELYQWNPRPLVFRGRLGRLLPLRRRSPVNNFGDLLGPMITRAIAEQRGGVELDPSDRTLFSIGSVIHHAKTGDVIWGSGVNGKIPPERHRFDDLDVRAVRGPKTRQFLMNMGIAVPEVYGDPALLLPAIRPDLLDVAQKKERRLTVIPNLNDLNRYRDREHLDPRSHLETVLHTIATSELVVGSSLHGIIVAESLGVPARLVRSDAEPLFKYLDYFEGSGRDGVEIADSVDEAIRMGGGPQLEFDSRPLLSAFPSDLWVARAEVSP